MTRFSRLVAIAALLLAWAVPAHADISYTQGVGTTIFDFTCFTTKHCTAHVNVNSAGTEIFTSTTPGNVNIAQWGGTAITNVPTAIGTVGTGNTGTINTFTVGCSGTVCNANVANNGDGVAAALSAGQPVVNYEFIYNGTTWDRRRSGATTGAGLAQLATLFPTAATPIQASATGTTGATTATLAGTSNKTTYICGFTILANASSAATGTATVTGVTTTMSFVQFTAPLASGIGNVSATFNPCQPASATNTGIAVASAAPGTGGTVSVAAWGYQQ